MVKIMRQAAFMDSWARPKNQVNLDADRVGWTRGRFLELGRIGTGSGAASKLQYSFLNC